MLTSSPSNLTDRHHRAAQRILDQLDRAASRTDAQYSRIRKHDRKGYRSPLSIFVPRGDTDRPPEQEDAFCYPAWSYSLSQGGVGLIMLDQLEVTDVWVGVHLPNKTIRWMSGRIVRCRRIPEEEFFECGLSFRQKPVENGE